MEVIPAKGLEHHGISGVTTRAPEPGAPIARGEPVGSRAAPTSMPGMPSAVVQVPKERHGMAEAIGEHMGGFHDRLARLERFVMMNMGRRTLADLDEDMDAVDRRRLGEFAKVPAPDVTGKVPKPDVAGKVPEPGESGETVIGQDRTATEIRGDMAGETAELNKPDGDAPSSEN